MTDKTGIAVAASVTALVIGSLAYAGANAGSNGADPPVTSTPGSALEGGQPAAGTEDRPRTGDRSADKRQSRGGDDRGSKREDNRRSEDYSRGGNERSNRDSRDHEDGGRQVIGVQEGEGDE